MHHYTWKDAPVLRFLHDKNSLQTTHEQMLLTIITTITIVEYTIITLPLNGCCFLIIPCNVLQGARQHLLRAPSRQPAGRASGALYQHPRVPL